MLRQQQPAEVIHQLTTKNSQQLHHHIIGQPQQLVEAAIQAPDQPLVLPPIRRPPHQQEVQLINQAEAVLINQVQAEQLQAATRAVPHTPHHAITQAPTHTLRQTIVLAAVARHEVILLRAAQVHRGRRVELQEEEAALAPQAEEAEEAVLAHQEGNITTGQTSHT